MRMLCGIALITLFMLVYVTSLRAASVNVRAPDLKLIQGRWWYYSAGDSPEGGYMGQLKADAASLEGVFALPDTLKPGKHYVFLKGINYYDAILYSYRLLGRDPDWSEWTPKTFVDYADLGPGNFQFEVRAKDEAGNISDTAVRVLSSW